MSLQPTEGRIIRPIIAHLNYAYFQHNAQQETYLFHTHYVNGTDYKTTIFAAEAEDIIQYFINQKLFAIETITELQQRRTYFVSPRAVLAFQTEEQDNEVRYLIALPGQTLMLTTTKDNPTHFALQSALNALLTPGQAQPGQTT